MPTGRNFHQSKLEPVCKGADFVLLCDSKANFVGAPCWFKSELPFGMMDIQQIWPSLFQQYPHHLGSRTGKLGCMKQECFWHLCVGLLFEILAPPIFIYSHFAHIMYWGLQSCRRLRFGAHLESFAGWTASVRTFLRGLTSHLIRFTSCQTVALQSYATFSQQERNSL